MTPKQIKSKVKEMKRLVDQYLIYINKSRDNAVKAQSLKTKAVRIYESLSEDERIMYKNEIVSILQKINL